MKKRGLLLVLILCAPSFPQDATESRIAIALPTTDHVAPAVRTARDNLYVLRQMGPSGRGPARGSLPPIQNDKPGMPPHLTVYHAVLGPELPIGISNTVVTGAINSLDPHEMALGQGIYTEFHVTVNNVLKSPPGILDNPNIDLIEPGGAALRPDGREERLITKGPGISLRPVSAT